MARCRSDWYGLGLDELRDKFLAIKKDQMFCDVVVFTTKMDIMAHRCILTASSQFFTSVLHDTKSEALAGMTDKAKQGRELPVIDCSSQVSNPEMLERVIEFMYTGCIAINDENVGDLFNTAMDFLMMDLLNVILKFVTRSVTVDNCLKVYRSLFRVKFEAGDERRLPFIKKMLDILQIPLVIIQTNLSHIVNTQADEVVRITPEEMRGMIGAGLTVKADFFTAIKLFSVWTTSCSGRFFEAQMYLMDTLDTILAKSTEEEIKTEIIPLVFNTLDSNCIQEQQIVLGCMRLVKDYVDDDIMKSMVLPRAESLYNKSDSIEVASAILKDALDKPLEGFQSGPSFDDEYRKLETMLNWNEIRNQHQETLVAQCSILLDKKSYSKSQQTVDEDRTVPVCKTNTDEAAYDSDTDEVEVDRVAQIGIEEENSSEITSDNDKKKIKHTVTKQKLKSKLNLKEKNRKNTSQKAIVEDNISKSLNDEGTDVKKEINVKFEDNVALPRNSHFDCLWCEQAFNSHLQLKRHETSVHGDISTFKCNICEKEFAARHRLVRHRNTVHAIEKKYLCKICGVSFAVEEYLKSHTSAKHSETPKHVCILCGKIFFYSNHLKRHLANHNGEKRYKCKLCNCAFTRNDRLKRHMLSHSKQNLFMCQYCGRDFFNPQTFKRHIENHETKNGGGIKQETDANNKSLQPCDICGKVMKYPYMRRHLQTHVEGRVLPSNQSHVCPVCGVVLKKKCYMSAHMRVHTGVKPHTCNFCQKKFRTKSHMITHKRIHTGERPYTCGICPQAFSSSSALKRHKFTHTALKPHVCMCGASFNRSDHLKKHKQTCQHIVIGAKAYTKVSVTHVAAFDTPQTKLSIDLTK